MRILAEWRTWIGHQDAATSQTGMDVDTFFEQLNDSHSELLSFEYHDDKRKLVHQWLEAACLLKKD
jgi:hypothetical protein